MQHIPYWYFSVIVPGKPAVKANPKQGIKATEATKPQTMPLCEFKRRYPEYGALLPCSTSEIEGHAKFLEAMKAKGVVAKLLPGPCPNDKGTMNPKKEDPEHVGEDTTTVRAYTA